MEPCVLIVEQDERTSVIVVKGALDPCAASALAAEISGARLEPSRRVIVSLERCSRFSDAALGVLSDARDRLDSRLFLIAPRRAMHRKYLERRGFLNRFMCASVREARDLPSVF